MQMKIDLHIHTTASDGTLSPSEVVRKAAELGVQVIAITDHDSIAGIEEALMEASKYPDLMVIPGVEMGADVPKDERHILGYFVNPESLHFCEKLEMLRNSRANRSQLMVSKLEAMGIRLKWEDVIRIADGASIGRPHIAQAILEYGYVSVIQEAFDKYIGDTSPAYVEREKLSPVETVRLISSTGGLPVLAHPADTKNLDAVIEQLKPAGLIGMEVHYKDYDSITVKSLIRKAERHNLICCGGSDYHGFEIEENEIGRCGVPARTVNQLIELKNQRNQTSSL
jgi:predicted metal-dependent phosphoesterase TrpH